MTGLLPAPWYLHQCSRPGCPYFQGLLPWSFSCIWAAVTTKRRRTTYVPQKGRWWWRWWAGDIIWRLSRRPPQLETAVSNNKGASTTCTLWTLSLLIFRVLQYEFGFYCFLLPPFLLDCIYREEISASSGLDVLVLLFNLASSKE